MRYVLCRAVYGYAYGYVCVQGDRHTFDPCNDARAHLVRRQGEDTRQIVSFLRTLFFAKITHNVIPAFVLLAQHVEQKQIHVVVQRFVVEEQLCEVAQVLTKHFFLLAIHFEKADVFVAVNLIPRRMMQFIFT